MPITRAATVAAFNRKPWGASRKTLWSELFGSETLAQVYFLLAEIVLTLGSAGIVLAGVFYDNACALLRYVRRPWRRRASSVAEAVAKLPLVVDRLHYKNHTGCKPGGRDPLPEVDPEGHWFMEGIDSIACEQFFSWLTNLTYNLMHMRRGTFRMYLTLLFHAYNMDRLEKMKRKKETRGGEEDDLSSDD
jgi:hypothetical protein